MQHTGTQLRSDNVVLVHGTYYLSTIQERQSFLGASLREGWQIIEEKFDVAILSLISEMGLTISICTEIEKFFFFSVPLPKNEKNVLFFVSWC